RHRPGQHRRIRQALRHLQEYLPRGTGRVSEQDQDKAAKRAQWEEINRAKALARQQEKDAADQAKAPPAAPRKQFQAIKGTRDLLPPDTALWNHVEQTAREVF